MSEGLERLREYDPIHNLVYALAREKEIYCSFYASQRLTQIAGFILGLDYAGQTRLAEKMANDLFNVFDRLTASQEYIVSGKDKAPKLKHELCTDRAFFSFSFQRLVGEVNPTRRTCHAIASIPGVNVNPQEGDVSYVYDIAGGIIYDGPGGSRAYSVNLENDSRLWTIHS